MMPSQLQRKYQYDPLPRENPLPGRINDQHWKILLIHVRDRMTFAEIARHAGVSLSTISQKAYRASYLYSKSRRWEKCPHCHGSGGAWIKIEPPPPIVYAFPDLPRGVSRLLERSGYPDGAAVQAATDDDLLKLPNVGTLKLAMIRAYYPKAS